MKVLAIVGSLRNGSLNHALATAALALAPAGAETQVFDRLAEIPSYNQDDDVETPEPVLALRRAIAEADALVLATPEYNGSVSGVLKNAIDWASRPHGASSLVGKRALVLATSPSSRGAQWAREDLARILGVARVEVVGEAFGLGAGHEAFTDGRLHDPEQQTRLADAVARLLDLQDSDAESSDDGRAA